MWRDSPTDYKRAEEILNQALARPKLDDRRSVQERLADLHKEKKETSQAKPATPKQQTIKRKLSFRGSGKKRKKN